jgi:hypothetical protein
MYNVAQIMKAQGDLARAREVGHQVLEATSRVLGAEHPDTFRAMDNLAVTLRMQGDLAGARELGEQVPEARGRLMGAEHAYTSVAAWNLVGMLFHTGHVEGGIAIAQKYLYPLRRKDPAMLSADQREILRMLGEMERGHSTR